MPRAGLATKTHDLISAAELILWDIQPATVRAVCYKLFVGGHIPNMEKASTNRVSRALVTARENGWIPWDWIVDEGRQITRTPRWDDPAQFVETVRNAYRKDWWSSQPNMVIVVSEKATIRGAIQPALDEYGVPFIPIKGFSSATTLNELAKQSAEDDREWHWIYIGDFDPSGMCISEVDMLARLKKYGARGVIERIAITSTDRATMPHELTFSAHTKKSDSRYPWFVENYGSVCVELDALDPRELRTRVDRAIFECIDHDLWDRAKVTEVAELASIREFVTDWKNLFSGEPQNTPEAA